MAEILNLCILDQMLKRVDKNAHRVLHSNPARFFADASKQDNSFSQVFLDVFDNVACAFNKFMVKNLTLFPRFRSQFLGLLKQSHLFGLLLELLLILLLFLGLLARFLCGLLLSLEKGPELFFDWGHSDEGLHRDVKVSPKDYLLLGKVDIEDGHLPVQLVEGLLIHSDMVIHKPLSFGEFNFTLNSLCLLIDKIVVHHFNDFVVDVIKLFGLLFFSFRLFL